MRKWLFAIVAVATLVVAVLVYTEWKGVSPEQSRKGSPSSAQAEPSSSSGGSGSEGLNVEDGDVTLSVSGRVLRHGSNKPVASVCVAASNARVETVAVYTDEEGKFTLEGVLPGVSYWLDAFSNEQGTTTVSREAFNLEPGESRTGVVLYLCDTGSISGHVVNRRVIYHPQRSGTDGYMSLQDSPLPATPVVLKADYDQWFHEEVQTDSGGGFAFHELRPGSYTVQAGNPAGAVVVLPDDHADRCKKVKLEPGESKKGIDLSFRADCTSIAGVVSDVSGRPIRGATVSAQVSQTEIVQADRVPPHNGIRAETTSAEDGRYRLDGLYPADMQTAIYYLSGRGLNFTYILEVGAQGYLTITSIIPAVTEDIVKTAAAFMAVGDEEGEVHPIQNVPVAESHGNTLLADVILEKEASVSGRLVDTQGDVKPGTRLRMTPTEAAPEYPPLTTVPKPPDWLETDNEGKFLFGSLPAGSYRFELSPEPNLVRAALNAPLQVNAGDTVRELDVFMEALGDLGNVQGRVIDALNRKPIESFSVKVVQVDSGSSTPSLGKLVENSGGGPGTFLIEGVSPGICTLEISAAGFGGERFEIHVPQGQTASKDFALRNQGWLVGRVDWHGQESAFFYVLLSPMDGVPGNRDTKIQAGGEYRFDQLAAGKYLVRACGALSDRSLRTSVQINREAKVIVQPGMETRADFQFQAASGVSGKFTCSDRDMSGQVFVLYGEVADFDGKAEDERVCAMTWDTAKAGEYSIHGLPPGTYTVAGLCYQQQDSERLLVGKRLEKVVLGQDEEAAVDFDYR